MLKRVIRPISAFASKHKGVLIDSAPNFKSGTVLPITINAVQMYLTCSGLRPLITILSCSDGFVSRFDKISFAIWDQDVLSDDSMGEARLSLERLQSGVHTLEINNCSGCKNASGQLLVGILIADDCSQPTDERKEKTVCCLCQHETVGAVASSSDWVECCDTCKLLLRELR